MLLVTNNPQNETSPKNTNLLQNLTAFIRNPYSQNHRNQVFSEWKAITKAHGYNGSFPEWILEQGMEWYPGIPEKAYVDKILDVVRSDCQKVYYRLDNFHKVEFQQKVSTDFKELGGKFTYS